MISMHLIKKLIGLKLGYRQMHQELAGAGCEFSNLQELNPRSNCIRPWE